jgi:hypothetical protein
MCHGWGIVEAWQAQAHGKKRVKVTARAAIIMAGSRAFHWSRHVKIRKQIYQLTLDDIQRFPVWAYALDEEGEPGQDEATVRPVKNHGGLDLRSSSYQVRARFKLADGTELLGFVTVSEIPDDGIITIEGDTYRNSKHQPVILTSHGQVGFYFGLLC